MIRDSVRDFVERNSSRSSGIITGRAGSRCTSSRCWGRWGFSAPTCRDTGCRASIRFRTASSCRSWSGATRGCAASHRCRGAGDVPDPHVRSEAQKAVAPGAGGGEGDRLLRPDRARSRLRSGRMKTKAVKDGDHYVLSGTKMWITNGTVADVAVVWAKLDGRGARFPRREGMKGFSAPRSTRSSPCGPRHCGAHPRRRPGAGGKHPPRRAGAERPPHVPDPGAVRDRVGAIGAAMACFEEALSYTKERKMFGRPLASSSSRRRSSRTC